MIIISLTMLVIVAAAVLIVAYFAYPQRGLPVPRFPRLGQFLVRIAGRLGINDHETGRSKSRL